MNTDVFNIFYADDDVDDRQLFEDAAKDVGMGIQVTTLSDGNQLIDILKTPPFPDVLFLDLNMPVKNGYEVLKEIRGNELTKGVPVIIFSTSDDMAAVAATRELGANMYITKPSSVSGLRHIIKHSLSIDWQSFSSSAQEYLYRIY